MKDRCIFRLSKTLRAEDIIIENIIIFNYYRHVVVKCVSGDLPEVRY